MKSNKHKCSSQNSHFGVANRNKPRVTIIRRADGSLSVINSSAAARFVGISSQAFGRVIRKIVNPPKTPKSTYLSNEGKVKAAYPELFNNPKVIEE